MALSREFQLLALPLGEGRHEHLLEGRLARRPDAPRDPSPRRRQMQRDGARVGPDPALDELRGGQPVDQPDRPRVREAEDPGQRSRSSRHPPTRPARPARRVRRRRARRRRRPPPASGRRPRARARRTRSLYESHIDRTRKRDGGATRKGDARGGRGACDGSLGDHPRRATRSPSSASRGPGATTRSSRSTRSSATGRRAAARTHLVAPPGSGKTLLGFEILRRLGAPALVLAPNSAIQAQWARAGEAFGAPPGLVAADARGAGRLPHLPGARAARRSRRGAARRRRGALGRRARRGDGRAGRRRSPPRPRRWTGAAAHAARARARADHRVAQARDRARRRRAARCGSPTCSRPGARERVDALRAGGVAHGRPRRVPPPRLALGLRRARGARGARRRRPRRRAHRDAAGRADDAGGRALRGAARAGRLPGADAGRRARRPPRARTRSWPG